VKEEIKDKWVSALDSGEFKQTRGVLSDGDYHCALGVLCELAYREGVVEKSTDLSVVSFNGEMAMPPQSVKIWAGIGRLGANVVSGMNDDGADFHTIALYIKENL